MRVGLNQSNRRPQTEIGTFEFAINIDGRQLGLNPNLALGLGESAVPVFIGRQEEPQPDQPDANRPGQGGDIRTNKTQGERA